MARVKRTETPASLEAATGRRVAQVMATEAAREQLPRVSPFANFLYQVHPARFDVVGDAVVPVVGKFSLTPGVNGVDADRHGRPIVASAIAGRRERGWTVIPPEWYEDDDGVGYVQAVRVRGGVAYLSVFDSVFPGSTRVRCDENALAAWLLSLIDDGRIAGPSVAALETLVEKLERELAKNLNNQRRDAKYAAAAERSAHRLQVAQNALNNKQTKTKPAARGRRVSAKVDK